MRKMAVMRGGEGGMRGGEWCMRGGEWWWVKGGSESAGDGEGKGEYQKYNGDGG